MCPYATVIAKNKSMWLINFCFKNLTAVATPLVTKHESWPHIIGCVNNGRNGRAGTIVCCVCVCEWVGQKMQWEKRGVIVCCVYAWTHRKNKSTYLRKYTHLHAHIHFFNFEYILKYDTHNIYNVFKTIVYQW